MGENVAEALESRGHGDQREPNLETLSELDRFALKVRVYLDRDKGARRRLSVGLKIDLFDQIEQRDVVRVLIERGAGADREQVTPGHGASLTPELPQAHVDLGTTQYRPCASLMMTKACKAKRARAAEMQPVLKRLGTSAWGIKPRERAT